MGSSSHRPTSVYWFALAVVAASCALDPVSQDPGNEKGDGTATNGSIGGSSNSVQTGGNDGIGVDTNTNTDTNTGTGTGTIIEPSVGGSTGVGGGMATSEGGTTPTSTSGGTTASGGESSSGGTTASGGESSSGRTTASGGESSSGGTTASGGSVSNCGCYPGDLACAMRCAASGNGGGKGTKISGSGFGGAN